jgi:ABC-type hemin transport system ATPase subunit
MCSGLIDFGQSKQLSEQQRLAFARLVLALSAAEDAELLQVVSALDEEQQQAISEVSKAAACCCARLSLALLRMLWVMPAFPDSAWRRRSLHLACSKLMPDHAFR